MTAWQDIERLFAAALQQPPSERDAYLRAACAGEAALLTEVRSLVAAVPEASSFLLGLGRGFDARQSSSNEPVLTTGAAVGHYRVIRALGRGGMGTVYLAEHAQSGLQVALKTVRLPDERFLHRIRREIHALSRIDHPGIVRLIDHGVAEGLPWYAMRLLEGRTLRSAMRAPELPLASESRLRWALSLTRRLCAPLAFLHAEGLVHRDVKPSNVLLVGNDGRPVLVDFGLISEFSASISRESLGTDHGGGGTLRYMAPEQIRGELVDARADLFSLGCVLFELLTGAPPFADRTQADVLHASLEEIPPPPSRFVPNLPPEIDAMTMRLLAKDPRDRPGYAADVEAALANLDPQAPPIEASIGSYLYRPRLVAREADLRSLQRRLECARGEPGVFFAIAGESGIGKTRLALELAASASRHDWLVLIGEASEDTSRPLSALSRPLQFLADRCWTRGAAETMRLLGADGVVLCAYEPAFIGLPGLERVAAPADLDPDAARRRLFECIRRALVSLASERPVMLVVDDLHWADPLVLGALEHLAGNPAPDVVVVTTHRTEERAVDLLPLLALATVQVNLDRLDEHGVASMISDMLALREPAPELVRLVARHSEGNPFFVGEYLLAAAREGLIARDGRASWRASDALLGSDQLVALPNSLGNLVRRRLAILSPAAHTLAEVVAVIGRDAVLDLAARVARLDDTSLLGALSELMQRQIVDEREPGRLRFTHDKLREGIYSHMPDENRRALHQRVAEALTARAGETAEQVYEEARHYGLGTGADSKRVFDTNSRAGFRALMANAATEARHFFAVAARASTNARTVLDGDFYAAWGEACLRADHLDEAVGHLEAGISLAANPIDRTRMRARLAFVHLSNFEAHRAWPECEKALSELGAPFARTWRGVLRTLWDWVRGQIATHAGRFWKKATGAQRERFATLASVYQVAIGALYYNMDLLSSALIVPRALYPASRIGRSRALVDAYTTYALGLASFKFARSANAYIGRALAVAQTLDDPRIVAIAKVSQALVLSFSGRSAAAVGAMRATLESHGGWLSGFDYINACSDMCWNLGLRGYTREAWDAYGWLFRKLRPTAAWRATPEAHAALTLRLTILPLLGREAEATEHIERARELGERFPGNHIYQSFVHGSLVLFHQELGELGEPLEHAIRYYKKVSPKPRLTFFHQRSFYVFQALARFAQCRLAPPSERATALRRAELALAELRQAANLPLFRSFLLALDATRWRLRGRPSRARRRLRRAADLARVVDAPWPAFEVELEWMRLEYQSGTTMAALRHRERAIELARHHGWVHRLSRIEAESLGGS